MRDKEGPRVSGAQAGPPCPLGPVQVLTIYHCLVNQGSVGTRERFTRRLKVCCSNHRTCRGRRGCTSHCLQGVGVGVGVGVQVGGLWISTDGSPC